MQIIPAIDIQNSKVVRLTKGKFDKSKIYSDFPVEVAKNWESEGAKYLHVIDLDGAKKGKISNKEAIKQIVQKSSLKVQVGGGIRDINTVRDLFSIGVDKVILGTIIKEEFDVFLNLLNYYKEKIIAAVDIKDSKIVSRGWTKKTNVDYLNFVRKLQYVGVKEIIFTDVLKDGTLTSPNFKAIEELLNSTNICVIASGGITNIKDIENLYNLRNKGLKGIIIGKALYEAKVSLKECISRFGD